MNTEKHLDDISMVVGANIIGWMPTLLQFEEVIRILGLTLAMIYTCLKIIDWFREKRSTKP